MVLPSPPPGRLRRPALGLASPLQAELAVLRAQEEDHAREARALAAELGRQRAREAQIVAEAAQTSATWEEAVARQDARLRELEQELQQRVEEGGRLEGAARVREEALVQERLQSREHAAAADRLRTELSGLRAAAAAGGGGVSASCAPSASRERELELELANLRREIERLQHDPKDRERLRAIEALQHQVQRLRAKLDMKAASSQKYKDAVRALKTRLAGAEVEAAEGAALEQERQRSAELAQRLQAGADLFEQRFKAFAEAKEADLEALQRDRQSAIAAADKALEANRQLQSEVAGQLQRGAALEKELEARSEEAAEQRKRAVELDKKLEERAEELRQAVADNIELTREHQAQAQALRERPAPEEAARAARSLAVAQEELRQAQEERLGLAVQLADHEARAAAAERAAEEGAAKRRELHCGRDQDRATLDALRAELAGAHAQLGAAREESRAALDARERELAARERAEAAREAAVAEAAELRAESRGQNIRAEQLEAARSTLQEKLAALDRETGRLRGEVDVLESRREHGEAAVQTAVEARRELEEQCIGLARRVAQLEGELETKAAEAARERAMVEQLDGEKKHLVQDGLEKGELITKLYQLVRKAQDLHLADTRSLEAELEKREGALEEARRRFNGLQAVLARLGQQSGAAPLQGPGFLAA